MAGLISSRDDILGSFLDQLKDFSQTFIYEFNKAFTSGQGLTGYQSITSESAVADTKQPLDAAGLPFTPENGSFQVKVRDKQTGLTQTTNVQVDLDGLDDNDTSLDDLAAKLNAIDGVSASVSPTRRLVIKSESTQQDFAFANDTSGVLASLGVGTFFSGSDATNISVNQAVVDDPGKFAASRGGIGADTDNAVTLAGLLNQPLESQNGASIGVLYDRIAGNVTQGSNAAKAIADGYRTFEDTLSAQQLSVSGVSLDEEAVRLISYQRTYQASAKYISTLDELLNTLVQL